MPAAEDVFTRRLHPGEWPFLQAHFERLDPASRRLRFGNAVTSAFIERYARNSFDADAVVLGLFVGGVVRGVAELRFISADRGEAEIAFSIERQCQGFGYGTRLFARMRDAARNRGVHRLWLTCLSENRRILAIAKKFGAKVTLLGNEATAEISGQHPGRGSLSREWVEETRAQIFEMIDQRQRRIERIFDPFDSVGDRATGTQARQ
ncbi:GNAT family N-acetyltransferase [Jiella mangrovi]|uniref:GNAT family N-acetyltransferase n=1 Tax=Jiella mangrovi TaxID=2821407 RepID=A0ABS4BDV2_9HYPH|nr:GNAT family N-acetyltransferase [Jiella mangrovi]MBP0614923.1 GNAT family N-acetyltransferase [Jiella mangrovi]